MATISWLDYLLGRCAPRETWHARQKRLAEHYKATLDRGFKAAPEIAQLPEPWRQKIEAIREAHKEEIAEYHDIVAVARLAESEAIIAEEDFSRFSPNRMDAPADENTRQQHATLLALKQKDFEDTQYAAKHTYQELRDKLEKDLAEAFIGELEHACVANNQEAFLKETKGIAPAEIKPHLLHMLLNTKHPPLSGWELELPEEKQNINKHLMPSQGVNSPEYGADPLRLAALDDWARPRDRAIVTGDAKLSLAETINGIWSETLQPRLVQPQAPILPHMFSVIQELMATPRQEKAIASQTGDGNPPSRWTERAVVSCRADTSTSLSHQ